MSVIGKVFLFLCGIINYKIVNNDTKLIKFNQFETMDIFRLFAGDQCNLILDKFVTFQKNFKIIHFKRIFDLLFESFNQTFP